MSDPEAPAVPQPAPAPAAGPAASSDVVAPPAVPQEPAAAPATHSAASPAPKRRGLGIWSFVLALLAVVGDVLFLVLFFAAIGSIPNAVNDPGAVLAGLAGAIMIGTAAYIGGFIVGGIAILLGVLGLILNRGRVLSVLGILISLGVIVTHLAVRGGLDGLIEGMSGFPGLTG